MKLTPKILNRFLGFACFKNSLLLSIILGTQSPRLRCLICELCYGKFSRSVGLPAAINVAKVDASYENGILEITLPKVEAAKPKKVVVKTKETKAK